MYDRVTVAAKQLKVVRVHGDCRIVYVVRIQMNLVVDNHAGLIDPPRQAPLAQSALASGVVAPATLPCL